MLMFLKVPLVNLIRNDTGFYGLKRTLHQFIFLIKIYFFRGFLSGPGVKTPRFQYRGCGFDP